MKAEDVVEGKKYRFVVEAEVKKYIPDSCGEAEILLKGGPSTFSTILMVKDVTSVEEVKAPPAEPPVGTEIKRVFSDGSGSYWKRTEVGWYRTSRGLSVRNVYTEAGSPAKYAKWETVVSWDEKYGSSSQISLVKYTETEEIICERDRIL